MRALLTAALWAYYYDRMPRATPLIPPFYCKILQEIYYFYWIIVLSDQTLPSTVYELGRGIKAHIPFDISISHPILAQNTNV